MMQTTGRDRRRMNGIVIMPAMAEAMTTETMTATMLGSAIGDTMTETGQAKIASRSTKECAMIGITEEVLDNLN